MKPVNAPATPPANPLSPARTEKFVQDVTRGGEELIHGMSQQINSITIRRAMQIGYMMACQDHGLPVPEMEDPGAAFARAVYA